MKIQYLGFLAVLSLSSCNGPISSLTSSDQESTQNSIISSFSSENGFSKYMYRLPQNDAIQDLSEDIVSRLSIGGLRDMQEIFRANQGNLSLSPASYLLAALGFASVSDNFPVSSFGFRQDPSLDLSEMLNAWNYEYSSKIAAGAEYYSRLESVVAFQQVGPTYRFDEAKREALTNQYISTIVSSLDDYYKDATAFFHDELGFTIPVPDPNLTSDAVIAYGGLKMKDYVPGGLGETMREFLGKDVPSYSFGSIYNPASLLYSHTENYEVFSFSLFATKMVIVLPGEGVAIDDVDFTEAYSAFLESAEKVDAVGYVPYFHLTNLNVELTSPFVRKAAGAGPIFSKLLADDVKNDLRIGQVLQSNDFEFNKYGVSGESITSIIAPGSAQPEEHEVIHLDDKRPFYAISMKDGFPMFVNRINNLR